MSQSLHLWVFFVLFSFQIGMSPTRMAPAQGMMGPHGGNMVPQAANQTQFMQQFSANANAMNAMGQPNTQAAVPQVRQSAPEHMHCDDDDQCWSIIAMRRLITSCVSIVNGVN